MASRLRYEWLELGGNSRNQAMILDQVGTPGNLAVSTTVTIAGSRPAAPAFQSNQNGWCRIMALDLPMLVAWGANPTAADPGMGIRLQAGQTEVIRVNSGDLLSAIEVT